MFWILARIKVSVGLQAITGLHMYLPPHFIEADAGAVAALVAEFPLATLVATGPGGLLANHIPMLLAPDGRLIGHVAAANEIHRVIGEDAAVLAVFSGEDGYVSPNWYPARRHTTVSCRHGITVSFMFMAASASFMTRNANAPSSAGSRRASNAR